MAYSHPSPPRARESDRQETTTTTRPPTLQETLVWLLVRLQGLLTETPVDKESTIGVAEELVNQVLMAVDMVNRAEAAQKAHMLELFKLKACLEETSKKSRALMKESMQRRKELDDRIKNDMKEMKDVRDEMEKFGEVLLQQDKDLNQREQELEKREKDLEKREKQLHMTQVELKKKQEDLNKAQEGDRLDATMQH